MKFSKAKMPRLLQQKPMPIFHFPLFRTDVIVIVIDIPNHCRGIGRTRWISKVLIW
jgi:hypothetical protein